VLLLTKNVSVDKTGKKEKNKGKTSMGRQKTKKKKKTNSMQVVAVSSRHRHKSYTFKKKVEKNFFRILFLAASRPLTEGGKKKERKNVKN
jgi:hypothetical protein